MLDLILNSTHHQRYQNGIPVMGSQFCNRMIKIENKDFSTMFNGLDVTPRRGFLVTMWNMDTLTPTPQMQPKFMELVADKGNTILLRGVALKSMGIVVYDNKDYGITLYTPNRKVEKCVLHLYDRGVDIEYDELVQRFN